jgi:pimeloyl-ACP methyl ester carboxylesterase
MEPGLARLAGATIIPGAGHFLQLEQPEAVAAQVVAFVT